MVYLPYNGKVINIHCSIVIAIDISILLDPTPDDLLTQASSDDDDNYTIIIPHHEHNNNSLPHTKKEFIETTL